MTTPLRPSGASIWTMCAASARMSARMPQEPPSDPAREGTCAAWLAEIVLNKQVARCADAIGMIHENGWIVTDDMAHLVQGYVDLMFSRGTEVFTERKVVLNDQIAGTPDAFAVVDKTGTLHVDDLKFGYRIVEPHKNTQVSIYAGALLRKLTAHGVIIRDVQVGIYQPRAWHPAGIYRTWRVYPDVLMQHVHWIEERGREAAKPNATAVPGTHCRYCPATATCAVSARALYDFFEDACESTQRHMTDDEIATELTFLEKVESIFEGRKTALTAEAEGRLQRGRGIPGWHLEERRGNARFKVSEMIIRSLTGIDPTERKLISPAELIRKGADEAIVRKLVDRPVLKPTLKPIPPGFYTNLFERQKNGNQS